MTQPTFMNNEVLTFGTTNAKLAKYGIATFAIPAGYTCPGAKDCHAYFDRNTSKLVDGKHQEYRCYAASAEAAWSSVKRSVDENLRKLKKADTVERMAELIHWSLPAARFHSIRVHSHGDFYNGHYFAAWMEVARRNPERTFYAYTKSLNVWVKYRALVPDNFVLTASRGGKFDNLIDKHSLREAVVVYHPDEAEALGLEIDKTDGLAKDPTVSKFALLIHGQGPKGSKQNAATKLMREQKIAYSYGKKKK